MSAPASRARRARALLAGLERLLAETQETLAAVAADPAAAGARAGTLRRQKRGAARLLAQLEALVPPDGTGRRQRVA